MNVYDFDKTIFYPDSSYKFIMYCLKKYPSLILNLMKELYGKREIEEIKESIFNIIKFLPDIDEFVSEFWDKYFDNIGNWYLDRKKQDDLIISASPAFLIEEVSKRLGVNYIATPMNKFSGCIMGLNCHDNEKVRRFKAEYPEDEIDEFYSDSLSDQPLADIAKKAFLVKRGKIEDWP